MCALLEQRREHRVGKLHSMSGIEIAGTLRVHARHARAVGRGYERVEDERPHLDGTDSAGVNAHGDLAAALERCEHAPLRIDAGRRLGMRNARDERQSPLVV